MVMVSEPNSCEAGSSNDVMISDNDAAETTSISDTFASNFSAVNNDFSADQGNEITRDIDSNNISGTSGEKP